MPFLNEYYSIKKKIVNILINDEEFVKLLSDNEEQAVPAHNLIEQMLDDGTMHYGQIHLYDYMPGETSTAESHVCIEIEQQPVDTVYAGSFVISIDIYVPEILMNMFGNIRRDAIASRIDFLLNGQHLALDQLERLGGVLDKPIQGWRQRTLYYSTAGWNRSYDRKAIYEDT